MVETGWLTVTGLALDLVGFFLLVYEWRRANKYANKEGRFAKHLLNDLVDGIGYLVRKLDQLHDVPTGSRTASGRFNPSSERENIIADWKKQQHWLVSREIGEGGEINYKMRRWLVRFALALVAIGTLLQSCASWPYYPSLWPAESPLEYLI